MVQLGLEILLENPSAHIKGERIALLANPTSVDTRYQHAVDLFFVHKDINLCRLLGPEHGIRGTAQDMRSVNKTTDPLTGLPEISLYGETFASLTPSAEHLHNIDTLVFDMQDIGSRYYTYAATMALSMQAAKKHGVRMLVLDRPNPIGGVQVEGGGLTPGLENFCALYPIPQRHGLTMGELALLYNEYFGIGCDLQVVACAGWKRHQYIDETNLPWVMPSPNMPTLDTAIVYPGMCLLEGTRLSEGRGTTRPFEIFGAPFVDSRELVQALSAYDIEGALFRPMSFEPTFQKWAGIQCHGAQIHITDRNVFMPYRAGLAVLHAIAQLWPDDFKWRTDMYEFRDDVPAIDLLTGSAAVREAIETGQPFDTVLEAAFDDIDIYDNARPDVLLYE